MLINEVIKLKPKSKKALDWIEKIYSQFPVMPSNNKQRAMVFGQGEDQAIGVFELAPSMLVPDAVEIVWFQAYPTKSGIGKIAMQKLQDLASQDNITLTLYPWGKGVVPKSKLKKFYTAMGFKPLHKADMMIWSPEKLDENVEANPKFVYRIDSTKISDFGKNLRKYKHTADWSTSGLDQGDDWWNERGIKPETSSGIFAGTLHQVAPYATGNANQTRFVVAIRNNQKPILYFDIKDVPVFKNRKTYLTKFNGENFKLTPTEVGEYFSEHPGNPVEQIDITNPFEFIRKQGWDIKLSKDLEKELEEIKKEKNVTWRAEGMN